MTQFKIGDKVRVVEQATHGELEVGYVGIITEENGIGAYRIDDMNSGWVGGNCGGKLEMVEVAFSKKDLKTGDVVVLEYGFIMRVYVGTDVGDVIAGKDDYMPLSDYPEDMVYENQLTIVKVYRPDSMYHLESKFLSPDKVTELTLVYDRNEQSEQDKEVERLTKIIEEAKAALDKINK